MKWFEIKINAIQSLALCNDIFDQSLKLKLPSTMLYSNPIEHGPRKTYTEITYYYAVEPMPSVLPVVDKYRGKECMAPDLKNLIPIIHEQSRSC